MVAKHADGTANLFFVDLSLVVPRMCLLVLCFFTVQHVQFEVCRLHPVCCRVLCNDEDDGVSERDITRDA